MVGKCYLTQAIYQKLWVKTLYGWGSNAWLLRIGSKYTECPAYPGSKYMDYGYLPYSGSKNIVCPPYSGLKYWTVHLIVQGRLQAW